MVPNTILTHELTSITVETASRTATPPFSRLHGGQAKRPRILTRGYVIDTDPPIDEPTRHKRLRVAPTDGSNAAPHIAESPISLDTVQLDHHGLVGWSVGLGPVVVMGSFDVPFGVLAFDDAGVGARSSPG